jgi:type I restriction enzyme S subunit
MGGGLRQGLDFWEFSRMMVIEPPKAEQDAIVQYINDKCRAIDALIKEKQTVIDKWTEYKKSLIYYAITGKIDCRNEVCE